MKNTDAEKVSKTELDWRHERIRSGMSEQQLDGLIVYAPAWRRENIRYLAGASVTSSMAIAYLPFSGEAAAFVCSVNDEFSLRNAGCIQDIRRISAYELDPVIERITDDTSKGKIGIVGMEFMPESVLARLRSTLSGNEFVHATSVMDKARLVKSDWEISQLKHAGKICDASWMAFVEACKPGVREFEIVADVEAKLREQGAEDNFMLIASGGSDVRGMTPPSDRVLEKGDMVRTELTPQWNGYWAQICRTAVIGKPSMKQLESFAIFDEAVAAGIDAIHPGVTAHEVAVAENDVFRKHGLGEYCTSEYTRVRGHCLGLHLDEVPIIEGEHTVLEKNATLIVHPNTFTPLAGYHVLGDPVIVTEKGAEKLLSTPREFDSTEA